MNFNKVSKLMIPDGEVVKIQDDDGATIWEKSYVYALISNGSQAIDTGVYCTENMSCEIKIAWTSIPTTATYIGAIQYKSGNYLRCHFQCAKLNNNWLIGFWQDSPTLGNAISIPYDTEPHVLTYSAKDLTVGIDGNTVTHGNTPTPVSSTFYLFDRNVVGFTAKAEPGKCKVYYAKFWENGELIRDFIPRLDPSGKLGLFDLVNEQFYFDLNGKGFNYEALSY